LSSSSTPRAAPPTLLLKRIAQTDLGQVAQSWQTLCEQSGRTAGPEQRPVRRPRGINVQQDNADAMVDFAKQPGIKNQQALIANAVTYRKDPRNALNINGVVPSTLFCQKAPRNAELQGVDPGLFGLPSTGVVAFGARELLC